MIIQTVEELERAVVPAAEELGMLARYGPASSMEEFEFSDSETQAGNLRFFRLPPYESGRIALPLSHPMPLSPGALVTWLTQRRCCGAVCIADQVVHPGVTLVYLTIFQPSVAYVQIARDVRTGAGGLLFTSTASADWSAVHVRHPVASVRADLRRSARTLGLVYRPDTSR
jgi:hypothetical protein